jgi:hypothetical protein
MLSTFKEKYLSQPAPFSSLLQLGLLNYITKANISGGRERESLEGKPAFGLSWRRLDKRETETGSICQAGLSGVGEQTEEILKLISY